MSSLLSPLLLELHQADAEKKKFPFHRQQTLRCCCHYLLACERNLLYLELLRQLHEQEQHFHVVPSFPVKVPARILYEDPYAAVLWEKIRAWLFVHERCFPSCVERESIWECQLQMKHTILPYTYTSFIKAFPWFKGAPEVDFRALDWERTAIRFGGIATGAMGLTSSASMSKFKAPPTPQSYPWVPSLWWNWGIALMTIYERYFVVFTRFVYAAIWMA